MLASAAAKSIIKSYNEGEEINGVPLDKRRYGKMVFDDHITYNIKPNENKADGYRTPLLCNHGISGSGKTVQQALNMHWFIDRFKNGVAIEIIFNDDSFSLMVPIASIRDGENHIIDEWRWSQQFVTELDVFLTRKKEEKSMNQFNYWKEHKDHMPVFLIFSANKIESISNTGEFSNVIFHETTQYKENHLRENEGTMNLEDSKNWFPTFGYNLQAAHKLSQLCDIY